jgi:hypothetical protein
MGYRYIELCYFYARLTCIYTIKLQSESYHFILLFIMYLLFLYNENCCDTLQPYKKNGEWA